VVAVDEPRDQQRAEKPVPADQPASAPGDTPGALLAAARAGVGLSVDEVSARTRIRATLIRQMEEDDFAGTGGVVYARGHIRGIARVLGVDPEPIVAAYNAAHSGPAPAFAPPAKPFDPLRHGGPGRGGRRWGVAMVVAAALFCVVLLVTLLRSGSSGGGAAATVPPSAAAVTPVKGPRPPPPTSAPTEVSLRMEAVTAPSWLRVSDDSDKVLFQQILDKGATQTVTAKTLRVKIGDAGAMSLSCNGHDLGSLGRSGQVITVQLGLGATGACTVDNNPAAATGR
jgi:cytoskeletal protein RodZ